MGGSVLRTNGVDVAGGCCWVTCASLHPLSSATHTAAHSSAPMRRRSVKVGKNLIFGGQRCRQRLILYGCEHHVVDARDVEGVVGAALVVVGGEPAPVAVPTLRPPLPHAVSHLRC